MSNAEGKFCAHKTLWADFDAADVLLLVIVFLSTALSAPTGTGGGGIMVPVFMLLGGFTAQDAIPLSKVQPTARERSTSFCRASPTTFSGHHLWISPKQ